MFRGGEELSTNPRDIGGKISGALRRRLSHKSCRFGSVDRAEQQCLSRATDSNGARRGEHGSLYCAACSVSGPSPKPSRWPPTPIGAIQSLQPDARRPWLRPPSKDFRKSSMKLATDQNTDGRGLSPKSLRFASIRDPVIDYWEQEVRARVGGAKDLLSPLLTNTLPAFFDNIAESLSAEHPRPDGTSGTNSATAHGGARARLTPLSADQLIQEYHIFREAIVVSAKGHVKLDHADWEVIDRSINSATREAVRSFTSSHEEFRRKVAAALSHDMRTPLAVIANGAHLIARSPDLDTIKKVAFKIESNAARLDEMMGELLDALIFQSGAKVPLHLSRFNALDLVTELREQYAQSRDQDSDLRFEAEGEPVVGHWCRSSLRRALENLINNAIKYGDGGTIKIAAIKARERLMLTVRNHGNPILEERRNPIFEYLARDAERASRPGWGVGLQFVRTVAESHGGTASVDSAADTGTTFLIDLPVDSRPFVEPGST